MKKSLLITIFFTIFFVKITTAQLNDHNWILGYGGQQPPDYGGTNLTFSDQKIDTSTFFILASLETGNTTISNRQGDLQFYTGGCTIFNKMHQIMRSGDSLNYPGQAYLVTCIYPIGYHTYRSLMALPLPNSDSIYYLFHKRFDYFWNGANKFRTPTSFLFSKVDMSKDNGLGEVILKNQLIKYDTLAETITAVRHANGRDWWIPVAEWGSKRIYLYKLTPNGIEFAKETDAPLPLLGNPKTGWLCQDVFSQNGSRYARICGPAENLLQVFRFDRDAGSFYDSIQLFFPSDTIPAAGVAFSPNGRFLYASTGYLLWQFDLEAADISASRIKIAHFQNILAPYLLATFYQMQIAPNGKIYMSAHNSVSCLHVINEPDELGLKCNFVQRGLKLPTHTGFALPNFPNFRLGPLDNSPADSLGLDNHPLAKWRWRIDTSEPLQVIFKDLSAYEPTNWHWDFGDNQTSTAQSPTHVYATPGMYKVCEIVSNQYSADTLCRDVNVQIVSIPEIFTENDVKFAPNPVQNTWRIFFKEPTIHETLLKIYDITGQLVFSEKIEEGTFISEFDLGDLPSGLFFAKLSQQNILLKTEKIVKIR